MTSPNIRGIRFVVGSGDIRMVVPLERSGQAFHAQRRAFKRHLGLV